MEGEEKFLPIRRHLTGGKETTVLYLKADHARKIVLKETSRTGWINSLHSLTVTADTLRTLTLLKLQY
jgi:hypothetical protein